MIAQVPELYDGGYWYAVRAHDGKPEIDFDGWFAEYSAHRDYAVVRLLHMVALPDIGVSVSDIHPKFYARP